MKGKIKRIEIITCIIFFIVVILMNALALFLTITQGIHHCRHLNDMDEDAQNTRICEIFSFAKEYILKYSLLALKFIVLVCEIMLYILLRRILISELHFYYSRNKYNLIVLLVASWVYFWMKILLFFFKPFENFDPDEVNYRGKSEIK